MAAAEQAVRNYYRVTDILSASARGDMTALRKVSVGSGLNDARNELVTYRSKRVAPDWDDAGYLDERDRSVDLSFEPKRQPPHIPVVKLKVCYDVSGVNVIDASGKSVVTATRMERGLSRIGVANYRWPDPMGWRVAWEETKGEQCSSA